MSYLSRGSTGEKVRQLQTALNRAGATLTVDGDYGRKTEEAVFAFQRAHGLKADGLAGDKTWQALSPYMVDYSVIAEAVENCLEAVENLPEYKRLEALLYG